MKVLQKALEDGSFLLNLDARDMSEIVERTLQNIVERGLLSDDRKEAVVRAVLDREEMISTAIGHSIAVARP